MDKYQLMGKLAQIQLDLLDVVSALSGVERQIQRGGEERKFKLAERDIDLLREGFTVTLIENGTAVQVSLKNEGKTYL